MRARDWQAIANGPVVLSPNKPSGFGFDWPQSPQDIKYLLVPYSKSITASMLTATFTITADSGVAFVPTDGDGTAHVHLIICRPSWDIGGANDRWWSNPATFELKSGTFTLEASLLASDWTNVYGQSDADMFALALANPSNLGLTFGGISEFGHGVGVTGGAARFNLGAFKLA